MLERISAVICKGGAGNGLVDGEPLIVEKHAAERGARIGDGIVGGSIILRGIGRREKRWRKQERGHTLPITNRADFVNVRAVKKTVKQSVSAKRVEEIDAIQNQIRKLGEQYTKDFADPPALDAMVRKDLQASIDSLDLLKGIYRSKTEKPN